MTKAVANKAFGSGVGVAQQDGGFSVSPNDLSEIVKFAEFMSYSTIGIPSFLHNKPADCAAVCMQAMRWGLDPFTVAQKSYKVKDVIAYEAQLIAAVVNTRSGIKGRLKYSYEGEGDNQTCTVTGILDGEEYVYKSPPVGSITTKNSPLWKSDVQQQLGYYSARSWARRYTPEAILGAYDRDELQHQGSDRAKDVTPKSDVMARLQGSENKEVSEGFGTGDFVNEKATESRSENVDPDTTVQQNASDALPVDETGPIEQQDTTSSSSDGDVSAEAGTDLFPSSDQPVSDLSNFPERQKLILQEYASKLFLCVDDKERKEIRDAYAGDFLDAGDDAMASATKIRDLIRAHRDADRPTMVAAFDAILAYVGMDEESFKALGSA